MTFLTKMKSFDDFLPLTKHKTGTFQFKNLKVMYELPRFVFNCHIYIEKR